LPQKLNNAEARLMEQGRAFLLSNRDGSLGKFNLRELTAQCGMALGTYYRYFESKDDLVIRIMCEDWDRVVAAVRGAAGMNGSLRDKLKLIYEKITEFDGNYRYSAMGFLCSSDENMALRKKNEDMMYAAVEDFIRAETDAGELTISAKPEVAAYLLVQLLLAAGRRPEIGFDELWKCLNYDKA
jgi:AcrR family transcriptional regulator